MDPSLIVGGGLAVLGSKDLLNRLLGPTADYLGGEIKQFVEKCNINLDRIFALAIRRLGKELNNPGVVSPRVLKEILSEGRFCEDQLTAEYYGGILASSRTVEGDEDTNLPYLSMIRDLSASQLRFHFIFYTLLHKTFKGSPVAGKAIKTQSGCEGLRISIDRQGLFESLCYGTPNLMSDIFDRTHRVLNYRRLLKFVDRDTKRYVYEPTADGADLFMMANGIRCFLGEMFEYKLDLPEVDFPIPKAFGKFSEATS